MYTETETRQKIATFFENYPIIHCKKGELIYRPGFTYNQVSFVKAGILRYYSLSDKGEETTIRFYNPSAIGGTIFGDIELSGMNEYYLEAYTPLQVYCAPQKEFTQFTNKHPDIGRLTNRDLHKMIKESVDHIIWLSTGNSDNKVAGALQSVMYKFADIHDGKAHLGIKMSHHILASLTGLSRETVTLQLKKMEEDGLILITPGQLIINDVHLLASRMNA